MVDESEDNRHVQNNTALKYCMLKLCKLVQLFKDNYEQCFFVMARASAYVPATGIVYWHLFHAAVNLINLRHAASVLVLDHC